jgi:sulfate adenylyltransferase subunit 2
MATHPHHLHQLEAESIEILREGFCGARKPVMLYSIGKDSSVMLHLAQKAFYPAKIPFPLLHIDTTWKFQDMYAHRAKMEQALELDLLIYRNQEGLENNINPFQHGSSYYTDVMKTEALKQALSDYQFDIIFGGARRDEEKSRAKERVFSHRNAQHGWDPKSQRAEFWNLYNTRTKAGESLRVFPLSNWTELNIWEYILQENIPVVPLYLAKPRHVVRRNGSYILVDDDRYPLNPGETPEVKTVRFRTLGCYPLTAAIESTADTLEKVVEEVKSAQYSERQGRLIDHDQAGSMEKKKQEGYF